MNSKRLLITNFILYFFILLGIYMCANMVGIDFSNVGFYSFRRPFTSSEYSIVFISFLILTVISFYLEIKYNKLKICYPLAGALLFVFIQNFITIFSTPSESVISVVSHGDGNIYNSTFYLTYEMRWFYILSLFTSLVVVYLFLAVFPKRFHTKYQLIIGILLGFSLLAFTLIFSYITEWDKYVNFFLDPHYNNATMSYLGDKNNFAIFIVFGIIATLYIHSIKPKWYFYLIAIFLYMNIFFTYSKAKMVIGAIIIVGYLIGRFFITFKAHKKRNLICFSPVAVLGVGILVFVLISLYGNIPTLEPVKTTIESLFFTTSATYEHRTYIWENVIQILNESSWLFGKGFMLFNAYLLAMNVTDISFGDNKTDLPHNGYLQIIGMGGIVLLIIFALILIYFLYVLIKILKKHPTIALLSFLSLVSMLIHMVLDSNMMLMYSSVPFADPAVLGFLIFVPALSCYYHDKHKEDNEEITMIAKEKYKRRKKVEFYWLKNIYSIITPIFTILSLAFVSVFDIQLSIFVPTLLLFIYLGIPVLFFFKDITTISFLNKYIFIYVISIVLGVAALLLLPRSDIIVAFISFLYLIVYIALMTLFKPMRALAPGLIDAIKFMNYKLAKFHSKLIKKEQESIQK